MKWQRLDPKEGVIYTGILKNITENTNKAEWTDKIVDARKAQSVRYWCLMAGPEEVAGKQVCIFGNTMMNRQFVGAKQGARFALKYEGLFSTGMVDKRGVEVRRHVTQVLYKN